MSSPSAQTPPTSFHQLSPVTRLMVIVFLSAIGLSFLYAGRRVFLRIRNTDSGMALNRRAWEATYRERGVNVPPDGPREGYWGGRLGGKISDSNLGWRDPEASIPGLIEIDALGRQYASSPGIPQFHLVIFGASVASGAYASTAANTYFAQIARRLEKRSLPVEITVVASGGWRSHQELAANRSYLEQFSPDLVIYLNGLNDIANNPHPHTRPVETYLSNMREAAQLNRSRGISVVFALQPFLAYKKQKSAIEERILSLPIEPMSLRGPDWLELIIRDFSRLRSGLQELAKSTGAHYVDCSEALSEEKLTTFVDFWHFSDRGHELLAARLVDAIEPTLKLRGRAPGWRPTAERNLSFSAESSTER